MIILESLRCDKCHEPCRYSICKENNGPRFCVESWRLLCSECVKKDGLEECTLRCPEQLLAAVLLTNLACPEEAQLLDFGKWNPIACIYCHTPFEYNGNREIHCCASYSEGVVHCMEPACRVKCTHDICENMEEITYRLTYIMNEMRPCFLGNEYVPIRNKAFDDPRMDSFKRLYYCSRCRIDRTIADHFICGTELVCHACLMETDIDWEDIVRYHKTEITLAHIFPDVDDLKLLTFGKWTPFRCVNCSEIFSDDSDTHPLYLGTETLCVKCARDAANEFSHGTSSGARTDFVVDLNKELKKYFNKADDDLLSDESDTSIEEEEPILDRGVVNEYWQASSSGILPDFSLRNELISQYFNGRSKDPRAKSKRLSDVSDTPSSDAEEPVLDGDLHRQRRKLRALGLEEDRPYNMMPDWLSNAEEHFLDNGAHIKSGQALLVESLRCDMCENPCQFSICKTSILPRFCIDSRRLVCSNCVRAHGYEGAGSALQSPSQLLAAILLTNLACPEEIKLLDFGKWNPIACEYCHIPFDFSGSREIHCCTSYPKCVVHCMQPMCMGKCPRSICENEAGLTVRLTHIMNELRPFFSDKEYLPVRNKSLDDPRIDSLNWVCYCSRCGTGGNSSEKLILNGQLICRSCASNVEDVEDAPQYHKTEISLAQIFPDLDDLKQLTFEKWTPFRCTKCSAILTIECNTFPQYDKVNTEILCANCGPEDEAEQDEEYEPEQDAEAERWHKIAFLVHLNNKIKHYFKRGTEESLEPALARLNGRFVSKKDLNVFLGVGQIPGKVTHKRPQGQNLSPESLRCDVCSQVCRISICEATIEPGLCPTCGRLLCSTCSIANVQCAACGSASLPYHPTQLLAATLLASRACPKETVLLDFGKWNPFHCEFCRIPFEFQGNREVYCCRDQWQKFTLHCLQPRCKSQCPTRTCRIVPAVTERIKIIMKEMHTFFSRSEYVPVRNKSLLDPRVTNLQWLYHCSRCRHRNLDKSFFKPVLCKGYLVCNSCMEENDEEKNSMKQEIPFSVNYIPIEQVFPDVDDLKVLSFEKWTPFRCTNCSAVFTDDQGNQPVYHSLCGRTLCANCDSRGLAMCSHCDRPDLVNRRVNALFLVDLNKEIRKYFKEKEGQDKYPHSHPNKLPSWLERNKHFALMVTDVSFSRENLLGNGAQAQVFKGTHKGQDVALKSFLKQKAGTQDEFLLELEQFIHLHHPNLLKLTGYVLEKRWIVLEYCPNQSLAEYVHSPSSSKVLAWRTLIQWTTEIIEGMHYLHSSGVTHRDLKPDNILIAADWTLQIGDFARSRSGNITNTAFVTGNVGTRGYMAPELISGHSYGKKVDVWSFGVILWELCSRQRPFSSVDGNWATDNIRLGRLNLPELLPLPNEVNNVIKICLTFEAEKRPSFKELRDDSWIKASDAINKHADRWPELVEKTSEQAKNHRYRAESGNTQARGKKTYPTKSTTEIVYLPEDVPSSSSQRPEEEARETGKSPWEW